MNTMPVWLHWIIWFAQGATKAEAIPDSGDDRRGEWATREYRRQQLLAEVQLERDRARILFRQIGPMY